MKWLPGILILFLIPCLPRAQEMKPVRFERKAVLYLEELLLTRITEPELKEVVYPCKVSYRTSPYLIRYYRQVKEGLSTPDSAFPNENRITYRPADLCKKLKIDTIIYPAKPVTAGITANHLKKKNITVYNLVSCRREYLGFYYVAIEGWHSGCVSTFVFKMDGTGKVLDWCFMKECV